MKSSHDQQAIETPKNAKTPQGWQAKGAFITAFDDANDTPIGDIIAEHFCYCRPGLACDLCLEWNRINHHFEASRILPLAQSLRRQALGQIGCA